MCDQGGASTAGHGPTSLPLLRLPLTLTRSGSRCRPLEGQEKGGGGPAWDHRGGSGGRLLPGGGGVQRLQNASRGHTSKG